MDPREFFDELKRRNVFTVAVAYVVGGWALAEGISQVFPVFDIPNSVVRLIVLFIVLGFPVALVLSWFSDLTRYGIVRTPDRAPEAKIDIVGPSNLAEKSIAVLPFENLEEKANAYFASGMGDEVLTKLAQLAELKVISRASTERYQSHPDDLRGVGRQLGVATVLAGSVQKAGNEVLISVQLIDVRNGNQLWAQGYRRTLKNIFEVEAEVAEKVAEALKVKLVRAEAQRLATPATTNPRAHDLYLRAHALGTHSDEQSLEQTITLLRQALIEDPHFALAWGDLAWAYLSIVDAYRAPLEILTPAEHAALMAVANDEHAGAGHTYFGAIALIFNCDFPVAKRELERGVALDPNSSDAQPLACLVSRARGKRFRCRARRIGTVPNARPVLHLASLGRIGCRHCSGRLRSGHAVRGTRPHDRSAFLIRRGSDRARLRREGALARWGETLRVALGFRSWRSEFRVGGLLRAYR